MKLAMLLSCGSFEGFFGGVQKQTRQTYLDSYRNDWAWYYARALVENGIAPTIYIPALREAGRYETKDGIGVRFLPLDAWYRPMDRVLWKQASRQSRWSLYLDERLNTLAFMKPLRQGLAEDGIDHLYVQEYWSGRFDHLATRLDLPVSGADHGGIPHVLKWFKRAAFRKAAICYAQTQADCDLIRQLGGRAKFQPNGCDVDLFRPNESVARGKTILTVARLTDKQKRTSDLIRALTRLPEDWSLDIVGMGPDKAKLKALARELGVEVRVRFRGFLGHGEVRDLLWRCGVFAMPSQNEALAIAALEAMSAGTPVVLSRIPSFRQLVDDGVNGRLVPIGDVPAIAEAVLDAFDRHEALGSAAAATIRARYDKRVLYRELAQSLRAHTFGEGAPNPS